MGKVTKTLLKMFPYLLTKIESYLKLVNSMELYSAKGYPPILKTDTENQWKIVRGGNLSFFISGRSFAHYIYR
jgi:hypothetical protein